MAQLSTMVVVVDITFSLVKKICYEKGSTRKKSHRCDLLISIADRPYIQLIRDTHNV